MDRNFLKVILLKTIKVTLKSFNYQTFLKKNPKYKRKLNLERLIELKSVYKQTNTFQEKRELENKV